MAARTWPAGEAGPLGAQAGPCLCSEQGQPVTVGEGGRGQWVRHFQLVSHSHFGCVLPTWELGAGSQALGWPQVWHHPVSFPVSHFRLFLNKGLSSLKEHPSAHLGRPPSSARIHRDMAIWGGGSGGPCYLAAGSVAPEGWTPRLLPQGGAEVQPTSSEHSGAPRGRPPSEVCSHTTESRITEPRRTRGRGHTGDTSTKLSWTLSGLFSDSVKMRVPGELSNRAW